MPSESLETMAPSKYRQPVHNDTSRSDTPMTDANDHHTDAEHAENGEDSKLVCLSLYYLARLRLKIAYYETEVLLDGFANHV